MYLCYLVTPTVFASNLKTAVSVTEETVKFDCESQSEESVYWSIRSPTARTDSRVAENGYIVDGLENKFSFTNRTILTLRNTSMTDTGIYKCDDAAATGKTISIELIVLGKLEYFKLASVY